MDISHLTAKVSTCLAIVFLFFNSYPNGVMGSEQPATKIVQMIENIEYGQEEKAESFDPSPVYIRQGESVRWINTGIYNHTVTSVISYGKPLFFDQALKPNSSTENEFNYTFSIPGVFNYYCKEHPYMIGQVVVQ